MACTGYKPKFQDQINTTDPLGPSNCTCYSGAMAGEYDSCGTKHPTGKRVRELTNDTVGGTTLLQVDAALQRGWNINLDTLIGSSKLSWDQFVAKINAGHGAILQGSYVAIHDTKYSGDPNFKGNHAMYIPPGWAAMDPLCDGRRDGIYKYHGEAYPKDLLKNFAGLLELDPKKHNRLGIGWVWCSLTRDNTTKYYVQVPAKRYLHYIIEDGKIVGRKKGITGGFSADCDAPKTFPVDPDSGLYSLFKSKRLCRINNPKSTRYGYYLAATYVKER